MKKKKLVRRNLDAGNNILYVLKTKYKFLQKNLPDNFTFHTQQKEITNLKCLNNCL